MNDSTRITGYVYFIQACDEPAVKIGSTIHTLESRLLDLQSANHHELRLLGAIEVQYDDEGTYHTRTDVSRQAMQLEREIQRQFAGECIRGEWFNLTNELREFIKQQANVDIL